MLNSSISFLVVALIGLAFGFGGIASTAAEFAKILFLALAFFTVSLLSSSRTPG